MRQKPKSTHQVCKGAREAEDHLYCNTVGQLQRSGYHFMQHARSWRGRTARQVVCEGTTRKVPTSP